LRRQTSAHFAEQKQLHNKFANAKVFRETQSLSCAAITVKAPGTQKRQRTCCLAAIGTAAGKKASAL
jgi:hypothetical protein